MESNPAIPEKPQPGPEVTAPLGDEIGASARKRPSHIVGIGASAGGLEALQTLFDKMPDSMGMAFVIIQHLSPDFRSMMGELLSRHTNMAVHQVEHGMAVEPNTVYLIPPGKEMTLSKGCLWLKDKNRGKSLNLPIDIFFESLAADAGDRAVAIVLSGTGSDGTAGLCLVHKAGGLVLVQSESSAAFDGMPHNAIATGVADFILPPDAMQDVLMRVAGHIGDCSGGPAADGPSESAIDNGQPSVDGQPNLLREIFRRLLNVYKVDFICYKDATINRRIENRMVIKRAPSLDAYVQALDEAELDELYRDLLIGVTRFFRDPLAFHFLDQKVLPDLLDQAKTREGLRLWVAGCATGEEVYSLAILVLEVMERQGHRLAAKIFATDVHRDSLTKAASGLYPPTALEGISTERRDRFFIQEPEGYCRVVPELRQMVVFAEHDVTRDPPFTKMDMVSCRNLLIYFQPIVQKKCLSLFHFSLRTGGVLFLGPSETPGELAGEFDTLEKRWKIYTKQRDIRLGLHTPLALGRTSMGNVSDNAPTARSPLETGRSQSVTDALLQRYVPQGILIDHERNVVHAFGDAARFLSLPSGPMSKSLLDMVGGDLRLAAAAVIQRVERERQPVSYGTVLTGNGEQARPVKLGATPVGFRNASGVWILVTLDEVADSQREREAPAEKVDFDEETTRRVAELEGDLRHSQENLRATVEELETSNEELQTSNEELLASNEELQSTNEELHSVNEELYTVNTQHERKIDELLALTNDMDNLMASTEIGTIFVDSELRVRRFTPTATRIFSLLHHDVGRPLRQVSNTLDCPDLFETVQRVVKDARTEEQEVLDQGGRCLIMRVLPYRDSEDNTDGAVLTFVDVSDLKQTQESLRRAKQNLEKANHDLQRSIAHAERMAEEARQASEAKTQFLANMSHEIRTPMNGFLGTLDLLIKTSLEPRQSHLARTARAAGEHLFALLDGVLDYSKLDSGQMDLEDAHIEPASLVGNILEHFRPQAESKGLKLTADVGAAVPRSVHGDPERLSQILHNLVDNAVKFTAKGWVQVRIKLNEPVEEDGIDQVHLRFEVEDSGDGIAPELVDEVFKPFSQADSTISRPYEGTGLGLAISRQLCRLMGGAIAAESRPGEGSTFWFTCCLNLCPAACTADAEGQLATPPPRLPVRGARVLLVEDNEINRIITKSILEDSGLVVDEAGDGRQAIEIFGERDYDIVLMDVQMPRVDGLEAARRIRTIEAEKGRQDRVPILAMTAHAMRGDREKCLEAGMDDYIAKPANRFTLLSRMGRLMDDSEPPSEETPAPDSSPVFKNAVDVNLEVLDYAALLERCSGQPEMVLRLVKRFRETVSPDLDQIRHAADSADAGTLAITAHRLKGTAANLAAVQVTLFAGHLEESVRANEGPERWHEYIESLARAVRAYLRETDELSKHLEVEEK